MSHERSSGRGPVDPARASARLVERARKESLLDVAIAEFESPVGRLLLAATPEGLVRLALPNVDPDAWAARLSRDISPRILEDPASLDRVRRELDEYFDGRRRRFDLPLDRRLMRGFARSVLEETARIPYGETSSYAELAALAGSPMAHRAAGTALGRNPIPIVIPCHRVLRSGGGLGGYGGGLDLKVRLLAHEGALPGDP